MNMSMSTLQSDNPMLLPWQSYLPSKPPTFTGIVSAALSSAHAVAHFSTAVDAIIVGIETQDRHLASKKTWTRRMILLTDGESPIEIEDWEETANKMNDLKIIFTVM